MRLDLTELIQEIINLKKIKDGGYVTNLVEYANVGTNWIGLYCKNDKIVYFNSFRVEHVPKETEKFIRHKNIKSNIFWVRSNNSIMCRYFSTGSIDFMFAAKPLIGFTGLFSPCDFEKNNSIILSYFKNE